MTSTTIHFDKKLDFPTLRGVIVDIFGNVIIHPNISDLIHFSFDYQGNVISCFFGKDNTIYVNGAPIIECSSLSSNRPNAIKTKAFRLIAKKFNCTFFDNDCNELDKEIFTVK